MSNEENQEFGLKVDKFEDSANKAKPSVEARMALEQSKKTVLKKTPVSKILEVVSAAGNAVNAAGKKVKNKLFDKGAESDKKSGADRLREESPDYYRDTVSAIFLAGAVKFRVRMYKTLAQNALQEREKKGANALKNEDKNAKLFEELKKIEAKNDEDLLKLRKIVSNGIKKSWSVTADIKVPFLENLGSKRKKKEKFEQTSTVAGRFVFADASNAVQFLKTAVENSKPAVSQKDVENLVKGFNRVKNANHLVEVEIVKDTGIELERASMMVDSRSVKSKLVLLKSNVREILKKPELSEFLENIRKAKISAPSEPEKEAKNKAPLKKTAKIKLKVPKKKKILERSNGKVEIDRYAAAERAKSSKTVA